MCPEVDNVVMDRVVDEIVVLPAIFVEDVTLRVNVEPLDEMMVCDGVAVSLPETLPEPRAVLAVLIPVLG